MLVLGAIVVGAFLLYALLATGVDGPRVHPDEELYTMAASSLAGGQGLTLRGQHFGFGPLFPALLAAIIRLTGSVDAAYEWFKVANAFCFALTAVPVYLLARRLVSAWWAVLAAGLSVAIPSAISVGTVMTESLSYPGRPPGPSTRSRSRWSGQPCSASSPSSRRLPPRSSRGRSSGSCTRRGSGRSPSSG